MRSCSNSNSNSKVDMIMRSCNCFCCVSVFSRQWFQTVCSPTSLGCTLRQRGKKRGEKVQRTHARFVVWTPGMSQRRRFSCPFYFLLLMVGSWMTTSKNSLSGATMISCFFDLIRRKVRSFCGSRSRITLRALAANWLMFAAYLCVNSSSMPLAGRIGMPSAFTVHTAAKRQRTNRNEIPERTEGREQRIREERTIAGEMRTPAHATPGERDANERAINGGPSSPTHDKPAGVHASPLSLCSLVRCSCLLSSCLCLSCLLPCSCCVVLWLQGSGVVAVRWSAVCVSWVCQCRL